MVAAAAAPSTFAFIIHPIDPKRDVSRKYPLLGKLLSERQIDFFSTYFPPVYISQIEGIQSEATGQRIKGWFVACPYTPRRMLTLPPPTVYRKIVQTGRLAEKLGAQVLGLGAFTSVVGDGGLTIARRLRIPVTTGDSYTVALAVEAILAGAAKMGIDLQRARAAVVGAGGAIGSVCAQLLGRRVARLVLVGRTEAPLRAAHARVQAACDIEVRVSTDMQALSQADLVISVSNAIDAIIEPEHLQPGAVVCDVARPRDVSKRVAVERPDVLVIDGGMVRVPGKVNFNFNFGFPPAMAYACMAETMVLAMEKRWESFTLGKQITLEQVETIAGLARRHGFRLGGLRSFEKPVPEANIDRIRQRAAVRVAEAGI
ncbi:MAG: shikimate dehydrogenase [Anaerolineales bacterium]